MATTLSVAAAPVSASSAQSAQNVNGGMTAAGAPLAIHGHDSVGYFTTTQSMQGSAAFTAMHDGAAYRFVSNDNMSAFKKNPAKYLPHFGGHCASGAPVGKKFDGDPRLFEIVDGSL